MKKSILTILGLLILACLVQAEGVPGKSLGFGVEGDHSPAKIHVYIDASDPEAKTKNHIRYRILVDDRESGYRDASKMVISQIAVFTSEGYPGNNLSSKAEALIPYQMGKTFISPAQTPTVEITLPREPRSGEVMNPLLFQFVAFTHKCDSFHIPGCRELVIDTQGEFSSEDLKRLEPTDVKALLIKKD